MVFLFHTLSWNFRKRNVVVWTGSSWLRIGTDGVHLWIRFREMRGISWLAAKPVSFSGRTLFLWVRGNSSEGRCELSSCTALPIDAFNISKTQRPFRFHWGHRCLRLWFVRKLNLVVRKFLVCVYSRRRGNCFHRPEEAKGWSTRSLRAGQGMTMDSFLMPVVRPHLKTLVFAEQLGKWNGVNCRLKLLKKWQEFSIN